MPGSGARQREGAGRGELGADGAAVRSPRPSEAGPGARAWQREAAGLVARSPDGPRQPPAWAGASTPALPGRSGLFPPHLLIRPRSAHPQAHCEAAPAANANAGPRPWAREPLLGRGAGSASIGLTRGELALWVPGAEGPREQLGWGNPASSPRAGLSAHPLHPAEAWRAAPGARRETCKVLCWHLPPRDTYISVPIFRQRLRQPSESDQRRENSSPGRGPAP